MLKNNASENDLIEQAKQFIKDGEIDDAIEVCEYIIENYRIPKKAYRLLQEIYHKNKNADLFILTTEKFIRSMLNELFNMDRVNVLLEEQLIINIINIRKELIVYIQMYKPEYNSVFMCPILDVFKIFQDKGKIAKPIKTIKKKKLGCAAWLVIFMIVWVAFHITMEFLRK